MKIVCGTSRFAAWKNCRLLFNRWWNAIAIRRWSENETFGCTTWNVVICTDNRLQSRKYLKKILSQIPIQPKVNTFVMHSNFFFRFCSNTIARSKTNHLWISLLFCVRKLNRTHTKFRPSVPTSNSVQKTLSYTKKKKKIHTNSMTIELNTKKIMFRRKCTTY